MDKPIVVTATAPHKAPNKRYSSSRRRTKYASTKNSPSATVATAKAARTPERNGAVTLVSFYGCITIHRNHPTGRRITPVRRLPVRPEQRYPNQVVAAGQPDDAHDLARFELCL